MRRSDRLLRLAQAQNRIRSLRRLELDVQSRALRQAEQAREDALLGACGGTSREVEHFSARLGLLPRTHLNVEAREAAVKLQMDLVIQATTRAVLVTKLMRQAQRHDEIAREARGMADLLDRMAPNWIRPEPEE